VRSSRLCALEATCSFRNETRSTFFAKNSAFRTASPRIFAQPAFPLPPRRARRRFLGRRRGRRPLPCGQPAYSGPLARSTACRAAARAAVLPYPGPAPHIPGTHPAGDLHTRTSAPAYQSLRFPAFRAVGFPSLERFLRNESGLAYSSNRFDALQLVRRDGMECVPQIPVLLPV
jgi:hypothetical protein